MSKIEWTDATWNPVRGCSLVSPGCTNCYAMKTAHRMSGKGGAYEGLTKLSKGGPVWTGEVRCVPEKLAYPLHWRKPRMVFVNSMSDLFHEDVPDEFIAAVFGVMAATPQHTYQVLTKRPGRAVEWFSAAPGPDQDAWMECRKAAGRTLCRTGLLTVRRYWPLPNVWLGVSVEDQQRADERIPLLLEIPAAVRFLSCEPLLGTVEFTDGPLDPESTMGEWSLLDGIDWVIVGGESGQGARPCDMEWVRAIRDQCRDAGVACFIKQLGRRVCYGRSTQFHLRDRNGGDISEWPEDLRVREWPEAGRE